MLKGCLLLTGLLKNLPAKRMETAFAAFLVRPADSMQGLFHRPHKTLPAFLKSLNNFCFV